MPIQAYWIGLNLSAMYPEIPNNQELARISSIAVNRLARFSSVNVGEIQQTFLFTDDNFCGIRFDVGAFTAQWLFGQRNIEFVRGNRVIDQTILDIPGVPDRRAA